MMIQFFSERLYSDIRNMVRIHRNHASLFFWEPILNETNYPITFAKKALDICNEEYPYPYSIAACDHGAAGDNYYLLLLRPIENKLEKSKTYFIREWGDNVDDWNAQIRTVVLLVDGEKCLCSCRPNIMLVLRISRIILYCAMKLFVISLSRLSALVSGTRLTIKGDIMLILSMVV